MKTISQINSQIAVAYTTAGATWVRIKDIAKATGLTAEELAEGIRDLIKDDSFRAEPHFMEHCGLDADDRKYAVMIGGEARHMISWE